jgi:hypothetical protein
MTALAGEARDEAARIRSHLRAHAPEYLGSPVTEITLVREDLRPFSRIYRFRVGTRNGARMLLVKVSGAGGQTGRIRSPDALRPRIIDRARPPMSTRYEHAALLRIHEYFSSLDDPRFAPVRVYGLLDDARGIIMEAVDRPTLRTVAFRAARWPTRKRLAAARRAFEHAGAWLGVYQSIEVAASVDERIVRRDDLGAFIGALAAYLAPHEDPRFLDRVVRACDELVDGLPRQLPTGLAHGDFAMRNVMVGDDGSVTAIDTLARYRTATCRDLGYFLADLHASRLPAIASGAFLHAQHETGFRQAVLRGYLGPPPWPVPELRLYEALGLLERWASIVERGAEGGRTLRERLSARFYRAALSKALGVPE